MRLEFFKTDLPFLETYSNLGDEDAFVFQELPIFNQFLERLQRVTNQDLYASSLYKTSLLFARYRSQDQIIDGVVSIRTEKDLLSYMIVDLSKLPETFNLVVVYENGRPRSSLIKKEDLELHLSMLKLKPDDTLYVVAEYPE